MKLQLISVIVCAGFAFAAPKEQTDTSLDVLSSVGIDIFARVEPLNPPSMNRLLVEFRIVSRDVMADELKIFLDVYSNAEQILSVELPTQRVKIDDDSWYSAAYFHAVSDTLKNCRIRFTHRRGVDPNTYVIPAVLLLDAPPIQ